MAPVPLASAVEAALTKVAAAAAQMRQIVSPTAHDVLGLRRLLERAAKVLSDGLPLPPRTTLYARLGAIEGHYALPRPLARRLSIVRRRLSEVLHDESAPPATSGDMREGAEVLLDLCARFGISALATLVPPPALDSAAAIAAEDAVLARAEPSTVGQPSLSSVPGSAARRLVGTSASIPHLVAEPDLAGIQRLVVLDVHTRDDAGLSLECLHEEADDPIRIELSAEWSTVVPPRGTTICTHSLRRLGPGCWMTDSDSLVVLEPDALVDATDVANSFHATPSSPLLALAEVIRPRTTAPAAVAGTIANAILDDLVASDASVVAQLLDQKSIAYATDLAELPPEGEQEVMRILEEQLDALQRVGARLRARKPSIERTLMSAEYGLHGRPDYLISDPGNGSTLVDLKAGKAPAATSCPEHDAFRSSVGVRTNHAAQMVCYVLLVRSAMDTEAEPSVLYLRAVADELRASAALDKALRAGLRRVYCTPEAERAVLVARNEIVALELAILGASPGIFPSPLQAPTPVAPWSAAAVRRAVRCFDLVRHAPTGNPENALWRLIRHTMRALWTQRLGQGETSHSRGGVALLWTVDSLRSKAESYAAVGYLKPHFDTSDPGQRQYDFDLDRTGAVESEPAGRLANNFRGEDRVVLYPHEGDRVAPLKGPLFKGVLRNIDEGESRLQLRVEMFSASARDDLAQHSHWVVEHDESDRLARAPLAGLVSLLGDPDRRRRVRVLLGFEPPGSSGEERAGMPTRRRDGTEVAGDPLPRIAARAAAATDYFLIQGPPGTGKTHRLLPEIVERLEPTPRKPVLALASTNRAVQEMRTALQDRSFSLDPLYTRDKRSAPGPGQRRAGDIRRDLERAQVHVMTVAKALQRLASIRDRRFGTVIVDEASQLLDDQLLGILSVIDRAILIGDEKQLPPVQMRSRPWPSTFERLLEKCEKKGWTNAFDRLTVQYRMHEEIQRFPSERFYGGRLTVGEPRQREQGRWRAFRDSEDVWSDALLARRVAFVSVREDERRQKLMHAGEAEIVARITRALQQRLPSTEPGDRPSVGIIAPFRRQVAEIRRALHKYGCAGGVDVDTVERFQGSQRDIVIVSCTADDEAERLASEVLSPDEDVDRKFNVSITRPREHLIVVGHEDTLRKGTHTSAFLDHVRQHGAWVDAASLALDRDGGR